MVQFGHFLFSFRDYLFPLTFLVFLLTTGPVFPFGSEQGDLVMDGIGIIIALLGQGYRLLTAGCAKNIRRRGRQGHIGAVRVINDGMFAHSRNPLYFGNVLIIVGFVVIANNMWWYLLVLPIFIIAYFALILAEEEFLLQKFGREYAEYCREVNRFWPQVCGLSQSLAQSTFDWRRAVRREYGNICSWGAMVFVMLIWEQWKWFGYAARQGEIHELFGLLFALLLVYVGIYWCKTQGMLRS
jgi:protein-S-isoprenylcysteine O-methyltransferase Ste14